MNVAPHAGAWIEIVMPEQEHKQLYVAPHAGAWIEIRLYEDIVRVADVAPHAGAWIEIVMFFVLPSKKALSHPMRVRGLKLFRFTQTKAAVLVAPHAGAWIEIVDFAAGLFARIGRTPCGCVD